jgi:hypothetical protein
MLKYPPAQAFEHFLRWFNFGIYAVASIGQAGAVIVTYQWTRRTPTKMNNFLLVCAVLMLIFLALLAYDQAIQVFRK